MMAPRMETLLDKATNIQLCKFGNARLGLSFG